MSVALSKHVIRSLAISAAAGIGLTIASFGAGTSTAMAANAPWCLNIDGYKDCAYVTVSQCFTAASGQGGQCDPNTAYSAYAQYNGPYPRYGYDYGYPTIVR
jgi:hypothetical protein